MTSLTSSVERTDLDFKISVALALCIGIYARIFNSHQRTTIDSFTCLLSLRCLYLSLNQLCAKISTFSIVWLLMSSKRSSYTPLYKMEISKMGENCGVCKKWTEWNLTAVWIKKTHQRNGWKQLHRQQNTSWSWQICPTQNWHWDIFGPRQANLVLNAYASSEGSGEPAHPRSLARTSAARSYKQWVKRNLQTESQIHSPSEWLGMRSWNLSWRNARRHKFAWLGPF